MIDLEPLWKVLEGEEKIDLQEAILKAQMPPYESRMAVREVLMDFTIKWQKLIKTVIKRKEKIEELAKSDLFGKIILLEKCEESLVTPEGLDLMLWFEKLRYCKTVRPENPLFYTGQTFGALNYWSLLEIRNGKLS
jgi:hypothetical protein